MARPGLGSAAPPPVVILFILSSDWKYWQGHPTILTVVLEPSERDLIIYSSFKSKYLDISTMLPCHRVMSMSVVIRVLSVTVWLLNNFYKQERRATATVSMDFLLQQDFYREQICSVSGLELLQFSFDSKTRNLARNLVLTIIICK